MVYLLAIYSVFSTFSAILYCLVSAYLVIRRQQLNTPFYTICIVISVSDIFRMFYGIFLENVPEILDIYHMMMSSQFSMLFACLSYFSNFYLYYTNLCGVLLLSVNRFTAIVYPMKHKMIWSKNRLMAGCAGTFIMTTPLVLLPVVLGCTFDFQEGGSAFDVMDARCFVTIWLVSSALEMFLLMPVLLGIQLVTFLSLRKRMKLASKQHKHDKNSAHIKAEAKLAIVGLAQTIGLSGMQLGNIAYMIPGLNETLGLGPMFWWWWFKLFMDFVTISNVYLLLFCSSDVRMQFWAFMRCKQHTPVHSVTPVKPVAGT